MTIPDPQRSYYRQSTSDAPVALPGGLTVPPGAWARADCLVGAPSDVLARFGPPAKASRMAEAVRADALAEETIVMEPVTFNDDPPDFAVVAIGDFDTAWPPVRPALVVSLDAHASSDEVNQALQDALADYLIVAVTSPGPCSDPQWWSRAFQPAPSREESVPVGIYRHPQGFARPSEVVVAVNLAGHDDARALRALRAVLAHTDEAVDVHVVIELERFALVEPLAREGCAFWELLSEAYPGLTIAAMIAKKSSPDARFVAAVDGDVEVQAGWLDGLCRAAASTGADIVVPLTNRGDHAVLPLGDDPGGSARRVPGMHAADVAAALRWYRPAYPPAVPPDKPCVLIRADALRNLDGGWMQGPAGWWDRNLGATSHLADDTYVWHSRDTVRPVGVPGGQRARLDVLTAGWRSEADRYRARVVEHVRPEGFPVQLLAVDLGPWGGSYATLRMCEELRRLGIRAQVGRLRTKTHPEAFSLGCVFHQDERTLAPGFARASGWDQGILVATHWSTGRLVQRVVDAHPGVVPAAWWQDLEHRFVNPRRPADRFPRDQAETYVKIPNRAIIASWMVDGARDDFGVDALSGASRLIPVGVDCDRFHPPARPRQGKPRVLAMWRPETPRRGAWALAAAYDRLRHTYGDRVSLELYGSDGTAGGGPWAAGIPGWVTHHGRLAQSEVADLMRDVDILVEPSEWQGFGLPGAEAMLCGAALVTRDNGGVRAYANGSTAVICENVAAGVERLLGVDCERTAELVRLQDIGPSVAARLDWPLVAALWVHWLADVWAGAGRAPDSRLDAAAQRAGRVILDYQERRCAPSASRGATR